MSAMLRAGVGRIFSFFAIGFSIFPFFKTKITESKKIDS